MDIVLDLFNNLYHHWQISKSAEFQIQTTVQGQNSTPKITVHVTILFNYNMLVHVISVK